LEKKILVIFYFEFWNWSANIFFLLWQILKIIFLKYLMNSCYFGKYGRKFGLSGKKKKRVGTGWKHRFYKIS